MFRNFFSTKISKVILAVVASSLLIFFNPADFFEPIRTGIKFVFSPFQKIVYAAAIKGGSLKDFLLSIGELKKENERLLKENEKLRAENARGKDIASENIILREQLDLLPRQKFDLESAHVIGHDPKGYGNWVEINKGADDGIKKGMPVIISQGVLVGKIEKVEKTSSLVALITNPNSAFSGVVSGSGTKGIVRGKYGLGLFFDLILQTDEIKKGDEVITAGAGNFIPKGLFIGTVEEVKISADGLFQQAEIISPVKFSKLEVVTVVKK